MIKVCRECGKEFETTNGNKQFCDRLHYRRCKVCGNLYEVSRYHLTAKDAKTTCSRKCSAELRKATNLEKYGGNAPACSESIRCKMRSTTYERYGVEYAMQSEEFIEKSRSTSFKRYGVSHHTQTDSKRSQMVENWKDDGYRCKMNSARELSMMRKYGVLNSMQSEEMKDSFIKSRMLDSTKFENFKLFKSDAARFLDNLKLDHKPTIYELQKYLGVNASTVGYYIHKHGCEHMVNLHVSKIEQEVSDFIQNKVPGIEIVNNIHTVITPYELDIYLPELNLAIECNPTATHNSSINVFDRTNGDILPPSYHKMKSNLCKDKGIRLIHIFGSEWRYKRDIIESILSNSLGVTSDVVYARKCKIKEVDYNSSNIFLDRNHRQGKCVSSVRLGLYHEDELVCLMTFGKLRATIGKKLNDTERGWELLRFCSKLDTRVVGGASKLFKHFLTTYNPEYVRSFSDIAHTKGTLYEKLGFIQIDETDPGYVWVDSRTDISYSRVYSQKHNICKFLNDPNIDLSFSERDIMIDHGYLQVFDSGSLVWEYRKNN